MRQGQSNRRSFFQSGMSQFWNRIAEDMDIKEPLAFLGFDKSYVRLIREAMHTDFEVMYCNYEKSHTRRTAMRALSEIDYYESILTIWKSESELKKVNQRASQEPVHVSDDLFQFIAHGKEFYRKTGGAFDMTSTPLVRCWGFFQRQGRLPSQDEIDEARSRVGMDAVELNEREKTIFFHKNGLELTPASLGKGYALDQALKIARQDGLKTLLLNGGGSSILASGAPKWRDNWQIDVRNPLDHEHPMARVQLRNQGFSTSGSEDQRFEHEGKIFGHILNPLTGWPSDHMLNVSVIAPTAAEAEALSTAFYVMGVEKTIEYCENHQDIGVLILQNPDERGRAEFITSNLNPDRVEVLLTSCQVRHVPV